MSDKKREKIYTNKTYCPKIISSSPPSSFPVFPDMTNPEKCLYVIIRGIEG